MSLGRRIGAVTLLSLAANLAALAKNAAIAARFGVSGTADLVAYAESTLLFLPTILLLRECFGLFISVYGRLLEEQGPRQAAALYTSGLRAVLAVAGVLSLIVLLLPKVLMRWIAPGLPPEQIEVGARLLQWISPALLLQEIAEFSRTVHNAHHRYAVPGLIMLLGNLVQTAFLVAFPLEKAMSAWILAVDAAALIQAGLLVGIARGFSRAVVTERRILHPELKRLARLVAPVAAGVILVQAAGYIERAVLSYLPPGSLATLSYSRKLISPLQIVLAASVALPIYVTISRTSTRNTEDRTSTFARGIEINLFLFVPLTLLVVLLAPEIIDLTFRRGLFAARDVAPTAMMLRIGVLAVLPASIVMLQRDFLYASSRTSPLLVCGLIHLAVTAISNLLIATRYGLIWIPIGVVAGTGLSCATLFFFLRARVPSGRWRGVIRNGGVVFLSAIGTYVVVRGIRILYPSAFSGDWRRSLVVLSAATFLGLAAYCAGALLLGHPLPRRAVEKIRERSV